MSLRAKWLHESAKGVIVKDLRVVRRLLAVGATIAFMGGIGLTLADSASAAGTRHSAAGESTLGPWRVYAALQGDGDKIPVKAGGLNYFGKCAFNKTAKYKHYYNVHMEVTKLYLQSQGGPQKTRPTRFGQGQIATGANSSWRVADGSAIFAMAGNDYSVNFHGWPRAPITAKVHCKFTYFNAKTGKVESKSIWDEAAYAWPYKL
jgi:hypothetical protein